MTAFPFEPRRAVAALAALACIGGAVAADSPAPAAWPDPATTPAERLPLVASALVTDIAKVGAHYVAVGERGHVLLSDDGASWKQADNVPTRAALTAVASVDDNVWAVGHDGVILASRDAGAHWAVQRKDPLAADAAEGTRDPRQGAPLLDVLFLDARHGFAIGAYSLMLRTSDGGATWESVPLDAKSTAAPDAKPATKAKAAIKPGNADDGDPGKWTFSDEELKVGQESDPHLNAIARTGSGALFVVGERGSAFRSRDAGATWQRLQLPYDGSMFGVLGYAGDRVLAFGLRGHVYESTDLGDHWAEVKTGTELSLLGGAAIGDGALIVGANGVVLSRKDAAGALARDTAAGAGALDGVMPTADGRAIIAGENGISTFDTH